MLIQLAVITGVAIVAAEWLNSLSDVRRVLRALAGAAHSAAWSPRSNTFDFDSPNTCATCPASP